MPDKPTVCVLKLRGVRFTVAIKERYHIHTNSVIERLNHETRRRKRAVETFPSDNSDLTHVTVSLKYVREN